MSIRSVRSRGRPVVCCRGRSESGRRVARRVSPSRDSLDGMLLLIVARARLHGTTSSKSSLGALRQDRSRAGRWDRVRLNRREGHRALLLERRASRWDRPALCSVQMEEDLKVFCGIDWAEQHHDVALVDETGRQVAKRRIADSVAGFGELVDMLAAVSDRDDAEIPVAIETPRGLLVAALRATGRPVFAINPMAVARYRDRHAVSRGKSDHADALVLANILRTDAHAHRPLPADTDLVRAIAVLARAHQDAVWRRTAASNELRSLLREYFPTFLEAFAAQTTNLTSADARAVLVIAPSPGAAAKLTQARIAAALRGAGRQRRID